MQHGRRATDYTRTRHLIEQGLALLSGSGWMANLADRLGWYPALHVIRYEITLPLALPHPPVLRVVFASDFHAGPVTHPQILEAACTQIEALAPDLLLLGGDFVSLDARYIHPLAMLLGRIPAPLGCYAVLGNHDLWADDRAIGAALRQAGIRVLINQVEHLPAPFDQIAVGGLDDPTSGQPDATLLANDSRAIRIALMHSPEGMRFIQEYSFDLAICGHTHGGQICLPGGKPLWLPDGALNQRYPAGRYHIGPQEHQDLLVSRGVGYGGLPIRLFAPPDIVCCTIRWREHGEAGEASSSEL